MTSLGCERFRPGEWPSTMLRLRNQTLELSGAVTIALLLFMSWIGDSSAVVSISRVLAMEPSTQQVEVGAGMYQAVPLPGGNVGDQYRVSIDVRNAVYRDISAFVVDEVNLQRFLRKQQFVGRGMQRATTPITIDYQVGVAGRHFVLLDNSYALVIRKQVSLTTRFESQVTEEAARRLHEGITGLYDWLKQTFIFKDFNISVVPCGSANAFSKRGTGDITLCTETILKAQEKPGMFLGVLMHELGHTLLGLWGMPGSDNEDMADEFAVQMLVRIDKSSVYVREFAEFFSGSNPWIEARNIINQGGRHSISVQRARNMQSWLQNTGELVRRWNRLMYPHMTESALRTFVSRPGVNDDPSLAAAELQRRGAVIPSR